MSFLNQLKTQAQALQSQRTEEGARREELTRSTELACRTVLNYLQDLARQLSVLEPPGPPLSLDGRTPWPAMKLVDFRVDARRKMLRDQEVFDYLAMGWRVVPRVGQGVTGVVSVNFPTEMRRVEDRLMLGLVKHDRREVRDPAKQNILREVRYEYLTQTRGSVMATADHYHGKLDFRLLNTSGFGVTQTSWPAARINQDLLDELAKRIVGQPDKFV
jgi:hypothetical protein